MWGWGHERGRQIGRQADRETEQGRDRGRRETREARKVREEQEKELCLGDTFKRYTCCIADGAKTPANN